MKIVRLKTRIAMKRNSKIFLLILIVVLIYSSCSHKKPYYHPGSSDPKEIKVSSKNIDHRIILIGDAGIPQENEPVLVKPQEVASKIPIKTFIFFLGDNLYPKGMVLKNDSWRLEAERRLLAQIEVIKKSGAKGVFIPGNHDWAGDGELGLQRILEQEEFIAQQLNSFNCFLPKNGCPGPVKIDLQKVRIIIFDSNHWFNDN